MTYDLEKAKEEIHFKIQRQYCRLSIEVCWMAETQTEMALLIQAVASEVITSSSKNSLGRK